MISTPSVNKDLKNVNLLLRRAASKSWNKDWSTWSCFQETYKICQALLLLSYSLQHSSNPSHCTLVQIMGCRLLKTRQRTKYFPLWESEEFNIITDTQTHGQTHSDFLSFLSKPKRRSFLGSNGLMPSSKNVCFHNTLGCVNNTLWIPSKSFRNTLIML